MKWWRRILSYLLYLIAIVLGQKLFLYIFDYYGKGAILLGSISLSFGLAGLIAYLAIRQIKQE